MKLLIRPFSLLILVGSVGSATSSLVAQASPEDTRKILAAAKQSQVTAHLDHLVNHIGPRLTSSENLTIACKWARDTFKKFGLDARIEQWGTFPVGFDRGPWAGRMTKPEKLELTFKTNAWTAGTKGLVKGTLMPFPDDEEEADELGGRAKGAWFLATSPRRGFFGGARLNRAVVNVLAKNGALGIISRNRSKLLVTGGRRKVRFKSLPKLPVVDMLPKHFDRLAEVIDGDEPVELEFDIRNEFKKGPIKLYNVIAELKGKKFPDEYVIVGGHIDSWDGATGTTDNGTGVATTIEVARLLTQAGIEPQRTIRFMLWSGEEQGLLGSKAFIRQHPDENGKVSAVLVHDGGTNYVAGISGIASMIPALETAFGPVLDGEFDHPFKIRKIRRFSPIGSDHDSYLMAGVPGFFWRQAGKAVYRRTHHTQHDTFAAAMEDYQIHSSKVIALGAVGIANLPEMLPRDGLRMDRRRMRVPREQPARGERVLGVTTDEGLTITSVVDDSVAAKAGLRVGDRFLQIGETKLDGSAQLGPALQKGDPFVTIVVLRKGKRVGVGARFKK